MWTEPKYALFGGYVSGRFDGDNHYVSARKLQGLYNLNPRLCLYFDLDIDGHTIPSEFGHDFSKLTYLTPDPLGKYELPK